LALPVLVLLVKDMLAVLVVLIRVEEEEVLVP
jgi:hypothetical protein